MAIFGHKKGEKRSFAAQKDIVCYSESILVILSGEKFVKL